MKIKDVAIYIKRGITPKYVDKDGLIVVNQKCIKDGTINYEFIKYTSKDKKFSDEKKIQVGDILINSTGTGTLGRVAYADKKLGFSYVDSHVTILRCENYNPKFLFYWLRPLEKYIESLGKGSTNQLELSSEAISGIEIPSIDISKQNKISEIISTYDDLIENNQKQIKLLEEAAQRLYKEWFVDFRFPGYENAKFIDGIPEGWRKEPICNIVSYEIGGGWGEDYLKEQNDKPAFVIRGTDLHGIIHGDILSIPYRYHTQSNLASRILQDGDIVFEVSGGSKTEGVARTLLIRKELLEIYGSPVMCASFCKLIRLVDNSLSQYMYNTLQYLRLSGKTSEFDKKVPAVLLIIVGKIFCRSKMY